MTIPKLNIFIMFMKQVEIPDISHMHVVQLL